MNRFVAVSLTLVLLIGGGAYGMYQYGRGLWFPLVLKAKGMRSVSDVIDLYSQEANERLLPAFKKAGVSYPPKHIALIAFKDTKVLQLWASDTRVSSTLILEYPVLAASGEPGPKLREGDRQVPEGLYQIEGLNPNSAFHLSMKLNYPNAFDLKKAKLEGRTEPGSNIFIHGKAVSVGCLAMGDKVIEELFSLVYATGKKNVEVLISPVDPSKNTLSAPDTAPEWTEVLYQDIATHYLRLTQ